MNDETGTICIVIPAHNEGNSIRTVVQELLTYFKHIVVVNDCSTDNTLEEATKGGAVVVDNKTNLGYDGALEEGFKKAKELQMKYVITADADGQHRVEDIIKIADILIGESKDLVVGIRPTFARFSEYLLSFYSRIRFEIKDPLCGLKGYKLSFYDMLGHFDCYNSVGTELSFFCVRQKCDFAQVPISIVKRLHGNPSFGNHFSANLKILRALYMSAFKT